MAAHTVILAAQCMSLSTLFDILQPRTEHLVCPLLHSGGNVPHPKMYIVYLFSTHIELQSLLSVSCTEFVQYKHCLLEHVQIYRLCFAECPDIVNCAQTFLLHFPRLHCSATLTALMFWVAHMLVAWNAFTLK